MARKKASDTKTGDTIRLESYVGKYQPMVYAGASGDFNPIHIDPEFGKMVGLGGNILHGLCTMAFVARMCTDWGGDPGALHRIKVRFAKPVKPEETVTVDGTITAVDGKRVKVALGAKTDSGNEVITRAEAEIDLD